MITHSFETMFCLNSGISILLLFRLTEAFRRGFRKLEQRSEDIEVKIRHCFLIGLLEKCTRRVQNLVDDGRGHGFQRFN